MKSYKTIDGVINFIKRNSQTGNVKEINGVLMVGMGVYAYSDVVTFSGVKDLTRSNETFYHFENETELRKFIGYLQKSDGYLCVE